MQKEDFRFLKTFVCDIAAVAAGVLLVALVLLLGKVVNGVDIKPSDYISALAMLASTAAVAAAIWVHRRSQEFNRSETLLREAVAMIAKAKQVLTDANGRPTNNRINWVTAARLITRAEQIAKLISVESHRAIFEAEHDYQRHLFGDFLKWDGKPLSAGFFAGSNDPTTSIGTAAVTGAGKDLSANWIPVRIMAVVYRFFQFPEGYADPLDSSSPLTGTELRRLWLFDNRGVTDYILFREHFFGVRRKVFQFGIPNDQRRAVTAAEIDGFVSANSGRLWDD